MHFSILAATATFGAALAAPFHGEDPAPSSVSSAVSYTTTSAAAAATWTTTPTAAPTSIVSAIRHSAPAMPTTGLPMGFPSPPALPVQGGAASVRDAVVMVKTLKQEVHKELVVIKTLAAGPAQKLEANIEAKLEAKVVAITTRVDEAKIKIHTLLSGLKPEQLAESDREELLSVLTELKDMVEEIEACIVSLAQVLTAELMSVLLPKLAALKESLGLLVAPVLKAASAVCALVKSDANGVAAKIAFVSNALENGLAKSLSPVLALVGKTLL